MKKVSVSCKECDETLAIDGIIFGYCMKCFAGKDRDYYSGYLKGYDRGYQVGYEKGR